MPGKHHQIAQHLIQDILSGHYRVSDRLPSERDLASRFCVNRGCIREAITKVAQMGLIDVQPGGARVKKKQEASLDIISHLLAQDSIPDPCLVDQIMLVTNTLFIVAAKRALELACDEDLEAIRALAQPLMSLQLEAATRSEGYFKLMQAIMQASVNLPLQIITRTLFNQIIPSDDNLTAFALIDEHASSLFAGEIDRAIAARDSQALCLAFTTFSTLNRETLIRGLQAARDVTALEGSVQ